MYLDRIICENVGPIDSVFLTLRKNDNDEPVPCVIVGENGSGKSILLSFVVDAFFEFADPGYENATAKNSFGHKFYKVINGNQIHIGKTWMCSYAEFSEDTDRFGFIYKSEDCDTANFRNKYCISEINGLSWNKKGNHKSVNVSQEQATHIFESNVLCFFPPSRYEKPCWLGGEYSENDVMFSHYDKYNGVLRNPIIVNNATEEIINWLLDITADSRPDLELEINTENEKAVPQFRITYPIVGDLMALSTARANVEKIMGTILNKDIVFRMGHRGYNGRRFCIHDRLTNEEIIPSLDALSTGQMALFLMFSTIIRYADHTDVNKSINLDSIQGIVVVDEIDLHLHGELQRNTVGKLMKLFPKVQFIISTHSPLVLLGLEEAYGSDLDIIEMPLGKRISSEQFSQFDLAFKYISETEKYRNAIRAAIDCNKEKPLIITEGATDWRHMKAAYEALSHDEEFEWIKDLEFEFLEYSPEESSDDSIKIKTRMSGSELKTMAVDYSRIRQSREMIFIADRDVPKDVKDFDGESGFKDWGNNVYSLVLPVPKHREITPNISIEFLYKDEDIKRWVEINGIKRRVFLGNEFRKDGHLYSGDEIYYCKELNAVGPNKLTIIDGNSEKKVIKLGENEDENVNYALSKMQFADRVLNKEQPFDKMDFSGFIPLFQMIKSILDSKQTRL